MRQTRQTDRYSFHSLLFDQCSWQICTYDCAFHKQTFDSLDHGRPQPPPAHPGGLGHPHLGHPDDRLPQIRGPPHHRLTRHLTLRGKADFQPRPNYKNYLRVWFLHSLNKSCLHLKAVVFMNPFMAYKQKVDTKSFWWQRIFSKTVDLFWKKGFVWELTNFFAIVLHIWYVR